MPSGLQTSMDAVLNKKFGTSTTYPATGWPDDVNLMGPLPEKTASGSIAHFSDGADDVPLKSWGVTLPASLSGYSAVKCYDYGKNMINLSSLVAGYVQSNGAFNSSHSNGEMRSDFIPVKPDTTYYFSIFETTGTADAWVGVGEYTSTDVSTFIRRDSYWRFTTSSTAKYIVVSSRNLEQATKIQLEIGNDPTEWEPYTAPTVQTANLGRTIYGGSVDVVQGTAEPRNLLDPSIVFSDTTVYSYDSTTGAVTVLKSDVTSWDSKNALSLKAGTYTVTNPQGRFQYRLASESYGTDHNISATTGTITLSADDSIKIKFGLGETYPFTASYQLESGATATAFSPYFAPFTFTPISVNSKLGVNNLWTDEGSDNSVTYRADINLALGGN